MAISIEFSVSEDISCGNKDRTSHQSSLVTRVKMNKRKKNGANERSGTTVDIHKTVEKLKTNDNFSSFWFSERQISAYLRLHFGHVPDVCIIEPGTAQIFMTHNEYNRDKPWPKNNL